MAQSSLSLEDQFRFQALRTQVQQAPNLAELRQVSLKLVDLMEQQKATVLQMLQQEFLGWSACPRCANDPPLR